MPIHVRGFSIVLCALLIASVAIPRDAHAAGHCLYKQLSPWTNKWYAMCAMPATAESCGDWAMSAGISNTEFADGACPSGVVGGCLVGGVTRYFYQGSATAAAKGCEQLEGSWQPNARPGT